MSCSRLCPVRASTSALESPVAAHWFTQTVVVHSLLKKNAEKKSYREAAILPWTEILNEKQTSLKQFGEIQQCY